MCISWCLYVCGDEGKGLQEYSKKLLRKDAFQLIPADADHVRDMIRVGDGRIEVEKIEGRASAKAPGNKGLGMFKRPKTRMSAETLSPRMDQT